MNLPIQPTSPPCATTLPVSQSFELARAIAGAILPFRQERGRLTQKRNPSSTQRQLIHLLSTEGLSREILTQILDTAAQLRQHRRPAKVKSAAAARAKSVFNLFFKNSTRTRTRLRDRRQAPERPTYQPRHRTQLDRQGRSLLDTIANLSAMAPTSLSCATAVRLAT